MSKNITINESLLFEILRRQLDSMEEGQSASTTLFLMKEQILENAERETIYIDVRKEKNNE